MKRIKLSGIFFGLMAMVSFAQADTIDNYMSIANNIPKMEMKADEQAQAWARSARNVLIITCESIAETMLEANKVAEQQGHPIFCVQPSQPLTAQTLNQLIQQTARELGSQTSKNQNMTVSEVAWIAVKKQYPCSGKTTSASHTPFQQLSQFGIQHQSANR